MTHRHPLPRAPRRASSPTGCPRFAVGLGMLAVVAIAACSDKPAEPVYDNVFDIEGPTGGDVFEPSASYMVGAVRVTWKEIDPDLLPEELEGYLLMNAWSPEGPYKQAVADVIKTTGGETISYDHKTFLPNAQVYYKIRVRTTSGLVSSVLTAKAASVQTPPRVRLESGQASTATRRPLLRAESVVNEPLELAFDAAFTNPTAVQLGPISGPANGPSTIFAADSLQWDFGSANLGDVLQVYVRSQADPVESKTDSLQLTIAQPPTVRVLTAEVYDLPVRLEVPTTGIDSMRFANSKTELAGAAWMTPAARPDTVDFVLDGLTVPPEIHGEFATDFGFTATTVTPVTALNVGPAAFTLDGGADFTGDPERRVTLNSTVDHATQMRFSESADFAGIAWVDYADSTEIQLSEGPGLKTIYGWYRNPFDPGGQAAEASITLLGEGAP
jgi:hypothetical protein